MTHASRFRLGLSGLAFLLLLTGCRTYGDKYGNEEATLNQIGEANEQFADDLARARTNLAALRRAAESDSRLEALAEQYAELLVAHEALLAVHIEQAAELDAGDSIWDQTIGGWLGGGDYRPIHRTYGAIISEEQIMRDRYGELLANALVATGRDSLEAPWTLEPYPEGRYYIVPPQYERIRNLGAYSSMERATGRSQGDRGRTPGMGAPAPEGNAGGEELDSTGVESEPSGQ